MIVILGHSSDAHAAHLKQVLMRMGIPVVYWDTHSFPTQAQLSWSPQTQRGSLTLPTGESLDLQTIQSVFWRNFSGASVPVLADAQQHHIAVRDATSTLQSIVQACPARWINSWQAYQFHQTKPLQLATAQRLGVTIPATLISNSPQQVGEFVCAHGQVIFKPVCGGAHTQFVTAEHLEPERLQTALRLAPITLQAYVPGTNVRTYLIGDTIYAAEIRSAAIDFRQDAQAELIPIALPDAIADQCRAIARAFFLEWTAIDWRVSPSGDYVFLEANPSPMFLHFEQQTGFPITQQLVKLLTEPSYSPSTQSRIKPFTWSGTSS
jgi:glutathione synthase/RimK-type ligase-like ATP-grasp enzyme